MIRIIRIKFRGADNLTCFGDFCVEGMEDTFGSGVGSCGCCWGGGTDARFRGEEGLDPCLGSI